MAESFHRKPTDRVVISTHATPEYKRCRQTEAAKTMISREVKIGRR